MRRHLEHLENIGVIDTHPRLDRKMIGLQIMAIVIVEVKKLGKERIDDFKNRVLEKDNVLEAWTIAGKEDYLLRVVALDMDEYSAFIDWLDDDPVVDDHTSYLVVKELKNTHVLPLKHLE